MNKETKNYKLRIVTKEDNQALFDILKQDKVIENLNMKKKETIEDINNLINEYLKEYDKKTKYPYIIIRKKDNKIMGLALLKLDLYNDDAYEYTIYLNPLYWNQGIYSEVLPLLTKITFEDIKISNFRGYIMEKNNHTGKVLLRNNFKLEKIFNVPGIEDKIYSYLITNKNN